MKKFRFSLETVLDYKNQALDALRAEHGAILAQVRAQEAVVEGLESRCNPPCYVPTAAMARVVETNSSMRSSSSFCSALR